MQACVHAMFHELSMGMHRLREIHVAGAADQQACGEPAQHVRRQSRRHQWLAQVGALEVADAASRSDFALPPRARSLAAERRTEHVAVTSLTNDQRAAEKSDRARRRQVMLLEPGDSLTC